MALALPVPDDAGLSAAVRALAEGANLGAYRFEHYKSTPSPWPVVEEVSIHVPDALTRPPRGAGAGRGRHPRGPAGPRLGQHRAQ